MTAQFLLNILLTIIWVFITGAFSPTNFIFGFLLSYFVLWLIADSKGSKKYFVIVPQIIGFIAYFIYQLFKASIDVAREVIRPKIDLNPGIIKYPLEVTSDFEITLLANLITMTPGSFSLDISNDRKILYIHVMHMQSKESFIRETKEGYEKRIIRLLR